MSLESQDLAVNSLILGANRFVEGRRRGLSADAQLDELRQAQRLQYQQRNAESVSEAEILEQLKQVDAGYQDKTLYLDTESDQLVQEDLRVGDRDNDPRKYENLRANAAGKRRAARAATGKEQGRLRGQAQFVDNLANEAAEDQKFFDFGLSPFGDNAIYAATREEPELVGERDGRQVYRYPNQDDFETDKVALIPGGYIANDARRRAKEGDRAVGRAAANEGNVNLVAGIRNELEAEKEARRIERGTLGVRKEQGDRNFSRIEQIKRLGGVGAASPYQEAEVGPPDDAISYETAVRMYNPDGETVGYADNAQQRFLGDVNIPNSSNAANAPQLTPTQNWVAQNQPDYTPYGDHQPKVQVMDKLRLFTERLNNLGYGTAVNTELRSIDEFEKAMKFVAAKAAQNNDPIYRLGEDGVNRPVSQPEATDILRGKMRYSPKDVQDLAYALFQLEGGNSQVNQELKRNFRARLGNPIDERVNFNSGGDIELARFRNEKVGRGKGKGDRIEIKGALAKLEGEGAQVPYYGAVAGEPTPRARFLRPEAYGMSNDEIMERYPKYGEDMVGVRDRFQRDVLLDARGPGNDSFGQAQHALDREFEARGRQVELDKEALELGELARLQKLGKLQVPGESQFGGGVGRRENPDGVPMGIPSGRRQNAAGKQVMMMGRPEENNNIRQAGGRMPVNVNPKQPIQQAPVPSIAPTPGDITGSQPAPAADAGRGGWMGGDNKGRVESPYRSAGGALVNTPAGELTSRRSRDTIQNVDVKVEDPISQEREARKALPPGRSARPLTTEMKQQLDQLTPKRAVNNPPGNEYRFSPDYQNPKNRINREIGKRIERENLRRRAGYGTAAAAGIAGLTALFNNRDQREEEQY